MVDDYTLQHLQHWLERSEHPDYREATLTGILLLLADDPTLADLGWPALRRMVDVERDRIS